MKLRFISRDMSWLTRFKRLFVFGGVLFLLISTGAFAFGPNKVSEFEVVIMNRSLRGVSAVVAYYFSLPFVVTFIAAFIASATWLEDKFRTMISSSKAKKRRAEPVSHSERP